MHFRLRVLAGWGIGSISHARIPSWQDMMVRFEQIRYNSEPAEPPNGHQFLRCRSKFLWHTWGFLPQAQEAPVFHSYRNYILCEPHLLLIFSTGSPHRHKDGGYTYIHVLETKDLTSHFKTLRLHPGQLLAQDDNPIPNHVIRLFPAKPSQEICLPH